MTAKRILALLLAAAMIAGAWVYKHRGSTSTASSPDEPTTTVATGPRQVICIPELEPVCRAAGITFTTEPAGATLTALAIDPNPTMIWVTLAPWPEMASAARQRIGSPALAADQQTPLGSSAVVIAAPADRLAPLRTACPNVLWTCVGNNVNKRWSDIGGQPAWQEITFRHTDPQTSAQGLAVLGAALAAHIGRTDLSTSDLAAAEVRNWANQLENANKSPAADPLGSLTLGSRFDLVGTLGALAPAAGRVATFEPTPTARVAAVVAGTGGKVPADLAASLKAAAGKNGWDQTVAAANVPDAVGMEATQQLWRDVIRR